MSGMKGAHGGYEVDLPACGALFFQPSGEVGGVFEDDHF
jgi:hypothetical protein